MAFNTGTYIIDFGTYPGQDYIALYIFDSAIVADAKSEAYYMSDGGADNDIVPGTTHTYKDHRYMNSLCSFTTGGEFVGFGFMFRAISTQKFTGTYRINWVWSN